LYLLIDIASVFGCWLFFWNFNRLSYF
jgi:hypothetical protein